MAATRTQTALARAAIQAANLDRDLTEFARALTLIATDDDVAYHHQAAVAEITERTLEAAGHLRYATAKLGMIGRMP
jgi:hypothetical protein